MTLSSLPETMTYRTLRRIEICHLSTSVCLGCLPKRTNDEIQKSPKA